MPPTPHDQRQRILIVDDDAIACDALADFVHELGYVPSSPRNGAPALDLMTAQARASEGPTAPETGPVACVPCSAPQPARSTFAGACTGPRLSRGTIPDWRRV